MNYLSWIKRYIDLGFCIHPCCPPDHGCKSPGKVPYDLKTRKHLENWQEHAMPSLDEAEEWVNYGIPFNLGFLCGSFSRLICIDVDSEEGRSALIEASEQTAWMTWRYNTGKGFRLLYKMPELIFKAKSFKVYSSQGYFEVLGNGRQSVLPPSLHPNGNAYTWCPGCAPKILNDPEIAPEWLINLGDVSTSIRCPDPDWDKRIESDIPGGSRNNELAKLAGHLLSPSKLSLNELTVLLELFNEKRCKPPLPSEEVITIAKSIYKREALSKSAPMNITEIKRIASQYGISYKEAEEWWLQIGENL